MPQPSGRFPGRQGSRRAVAGDAWMALARLLDEKRPVTDADAVTAGEVTKAGDPIPVDDILEDRAA